MEDKEYTEKEYLEDKKIAEYVFNKNFNTLTRYKEDMINTAIEQLIKVKSKYETQYSYFAFASKVIKNSMLTYIRCFLKKHDKEFATMNEELKNNENITLEDIISSDITPEDELNYKILKQTCKDIINKNKSKLFKQVATLLMQEYTPAEIGRKLNISRQCAHLYANKFKKELKKILEKEQKKQ